MSIETTAKQLMEAMQPKKGPTAYDTQATVTRVDGDTLWVHIPGGVDETPIQRTIDASEGDVVQVRVSNGSAFAMGNASAPPTDDTQAHVAQRQAVAAQATADEALELARLKVGYAEIDEAVINTLQVNGIEAGWIKTGMGGNLYPVYDSFEQVTNDTLYFYKEANTTPAVISSQYARHGGKVLRMVTASGATNAWVSLGAEANNYGQIRLEPGRYVASAYFRRFNTTNSVGVRLNVIGKVNRDNSFADGEWSRLAYTDATLSATRWTRVEVPFTVGDNPTYPFIHLRPSVLTGDVTVYVDCLQIEAVEEGQTAGEWHPAGTTTIDGGNIIANSIKANSIDTDDLMTKNLTATGNFQVSNGKYGLGVSGTDLVLGRFASGSTDTYSTWINFGNSGTIIINGSALELAANDIVIGGSVELQGPVSILQNIDLSQDEISSIGSSSKKLLNVYTKNVQTSTVNGNPPVLKLTKTVAGTTTAAGNISLGLSDSYGILSVHRTDANSICTPYVYNGTTNTWYAHITNIAASPAAVTSTSVTLEVDYYAK